MAYRLDVDVVDPSDGTIKVTHTFWGMTEKEARDYFNEHIESCEYFRAAVEEGRLIEDGEQIPEEDLPEAEDGEQIPEEDLPEAEADEEEEEEEEEEK
jgi:hypothetical protein